MMAAVAQSHHSRRSIRRKFARGSLDCANPGRLAFFADSVAKFTERSLIVRVTPNVVVPGFGRFSWTANPSYLNLYEAIQVATSFSRHSRCKALKGQGMLRSEKLGSG
jgi:hypothetical protein